MAKKEKSHIDPCRKCGHKTILATGYVFEFEPDQEPYKAGKEEGCEFTTIADTVTVSIHWCEKCRVISDVWISEPINKELANLMVKELHALRKFKQSVSNALGKIENKQAKKSNPGEPVKNL